MNARVLYHVARADFLERVRRYSFLLTLAAAIYLGYCCVTGKVIVRLGDYRGVYNSAWIGGMIALVSATFVTLVGFYIVKNTVHRDEHTRVGRILATTPITKSQYTVAKTISNFAVLATMIGVLVPAAVFMQWLKAEDPHVNLWALVSPSLLFALPAVAFTSALAVLFEVLPVLRGGVGNVIYFFLWTALLAVPINSIEKGGRPGASTYFLDATGVASVMGNMQADLHDIHPEHQSGASLTIGDAGATHTFLWNGLHLSPAAYAGRASVLAAALALALFAALVFHRFDPASERGRIRRVIVDRIDPNVQAPALAPEAPVRLSPVKRGADAASLARRVLIEFRLLLKGQPWWWYAVAAGLWVASVTAPLTAVHNGLAIAILLWPVLVWSQMGTREARYNTGPLIFCSERSLQRQLPAVWLAGVAVAVVLSGGLAIRMLIAGDHTGIIAWVACVLFIPSLALALGVWTGTSKAFEAVYTVLWYVGPANAVPGLDFFGATPQSARPSLFLTWTIALVIVAYIGRRAQTSLRTVR